MKEAEEEGRGEGRMCKKRDKNEGRESKPYGREVRKIKKERLKIGGNKNRNR